ncbi:MAG: ribosome biogenesis GTPase Der [Dehalococcoidia bacterium]|nr:ribosome biogenesis GTPase Der [Dehalococcoidia bacterium]
MPAPIVAIVGRANVGKSTLLNRLMGKRLAVVDDFPGITRDRVFASTSWHGRDLTLVDTAGWQAKPQAGLDEAVKQQVELAIDQADAIIFLTDAREGLISADEEIADLLRATNKPIILAVNKVDSVKQASLAADFYHMGIGTTISISAYHNRGIGELMDAVLTLLPPLASGSVESANAKLAVVGRPNVGKSTLLNALLRDERAVVHESPGTTRDALDAMLCWGDKRIQLIDTAGIRRHSHVCTGVDYYSLIRSLQAINRCDIALLLVDAGEFITAHDMHIAGYIMEAGKGMVLVINKWDVIPEEQRKEFKWYMKQRINFMSYVPTVYISAKLGQNINKVLPQAWHVWQESQKRYADTAIDMVVKQAVNSHPPPHVGSRQLRITKAYQDERNPASFVLLVNDPSLAQFSYRRYLDNKLRQKFSFCGSPLRLIFTRVGQRGGRKKRVKT